MRQNESVVTVGNYVSLCVFVCYDKSICVSDFVSFCVIDFVSFESLTVCHFVSLIVCHFVSLSVKIVNVCL